MGYAMADLQSLDLILFAAGTFAAALVPAHATGLIVAYGLIVQGISVWKLRRSINLARLLPFLLGAVIGADWRAAPALDLARDPADFDRHRADPFQPL
jgi:hypothetical protein